MRSTIKQYGLILLLVVVTVAVYWPLRGHGFIEYDDEGYIVKNYYLQPGITGENIAWAMTTGYLANWHPLTWMSHMLDYQLFGLNPAAHHLHSLALHLLTSIFLFLLFKSMTRSDWIGLFVALVFAIHPLHVESVAWASERKDTLSALFAVMTIGAYKLYTNSPVSKHYVIVLLLFFMGLLAKPMLVTLPFVLLLLDYWPLRRMAIPSNEDVGKSFSFLLFEKVPLLVLSLAVSIVTFVVQRQAGAVSALHALTLGTRLSNGVVAYMVYLGKTFWPSNLSVFYPYNESAVEFPMNLIAVSLLLAITVWAILQRRSGPYLLVGWFWFLGMLVPVLGIVQVGSQALADRYMYLPMIGLSIMTGCFVAEATRHWKFQKPLLGAGFVALALVLALLSAKQLRYWKDGQTLFEHALTISEKNWMAHYTLGVVSERRGNLRDALVHFERAAELEPRLPVVQLSLGDLLQQLGEYERSIPHLVAALQKEPTLDKAHVLLAVALTKAGKNDEALTHFTEAYKSNRFFGEPHHNLGAVLAGEGKFDDALKYLAIAQQTMPGDSVIQRDIERVLELRRIGEKRKRNQ
jgi:Flp pilus assembly protein TadD